MNGNCVWTGTGWGAMGLHKGQKRNEKMRERICWMKRNDGNISI